MVAINYEPLSLSANFVAHSLSNVLFAFFGLALGDKNEQNRFFFFEDICSLIMEHGELLVNSACL